MQNPISINILQSVHHLWFILMFCFLTSCHQKISSVSSQSTGEQNESPTDQIYDNDCHGVRKTIKMITSSEGKIVQIGDQYYISSSSGNKRYNPCSIPEKYRKEGTAIIYSGEVLEIFMGERLAGSPFKLTYIQAR